MLDSGWVVVVVLRAGRRYLNQSRTKLRRRTSGRQRLRRSRVLGSTEKSRLKLLIGAEWHASGIGGNQRNAVDPARTHERSWTIVIRSVDSKTGCSPGDQAAVETPVIADPGATFPRLILEVRSEIEFLVVVNAEGQSCGSGYGGSGAANLRLEEARRHAGKDHQSRESVIFRNVKAAGETGNF